MFTALIFIQQKSLVVEYMNFWKKPVGLLFCKNLWKRIIFVYFLKSGQHGKPLSLKLHYITLSYDKR